jgi:hypothetical protein
MPQVFYRKKFSYYLGEQRALDDIVVRYESVVPPTPTGTPNVTPTPTRTPNPTSTPTNTPTVTKTPTPTFVSYTGIFYTGNTSDYACNQVSPSVSLYSTQPFYTFDQKVYTEPVFTADKWIPFGLYLASGSTSYQYQYSGFAPGLVELGSCVAPTSTPTQTPTKTASITSTPTMTPTQTNTPTTPICWNSFTISGSSVASLGNGTYQEMITYSGGSLDAGYTTGTTPNQQFISGTAPDGNDYRVFGYYDGTYYYTYMWRYAIGNETWSCIRTTSNYFQLGGSVVSQVGLPNSSGSTTPDGTYYYPIAQIYSGFPPYTLTRGSICPTPTPTQTPTNTTTPTRTPNPTTTPTNTPTPTYNGPTTAGFVTSVSCGNMDISGGTFSITYNGNNYPLSTIYSQDTLSNKIPITSPAPGVIYDFQFNNDSGYTLCNQAFGKYNRMKVTVGSVAGYLVWNSITQYYSGSTLLYQDTSDFVSQQSSPYNLFGQTYTVNISVNGYNAAGFLISGSLLANEANDNITTENNDLLEIQ